MDVSRIEGYNPNKINWRNLTAKEILKYEKNGIEVPDVYVQWAHEFLNNVQKYDNDEVTYEKAKSITRYESNEAKTNEQSRSHKNTSIEDLNNSNESDNNSQNENILTEGDTNISEAAAQNGTETIQLTAAQTKKKDFQDKGVNLREQAESFTKDSNTASREAESEAQIVEQIKNSSDNEISELEGAMKELIAEAEAKQQELRKNVDKINNEKSDNSTFAKIDKLQKELENLGMNGQNEIMQSDVQLRSYNNDFLAGQEIMLNTTDFGSVTTDVGNELLSTTGSGIIFSIDRIVGKKAVTAGNNAVDKAQSGKESIRNAETTNNANIGRIPELKNGVIDKTGIEAQNTKQQGNASEQDPITGKQKEADKDVKTAQNDGTDTTDKLHISIDELVKRKVRRGEYAKDA